MLSVPLDVLKWYLPRWLGPHDLVRLGASCKQYLLFKDYARRLIPFDEKYNAILQYEGFRVINDLFVPYTIHSFEEWWPKHYRDNCDPHLFEEPCWYSLIDQNVEKLYTSRDDLIWEAVKHLGPLPEYTVFWDGAGAGVLINNEHLVNILNIWFKAIGSKFYPIVSLGNTEALQIESVDKRFFECVQKNITNAEIKTN